MLPSFLPDEKSLKSGRNQQNKGEERERSTMIHVHIEESEPSGR